MRTYKTWQLATVFALAIIVPSSFVVVLAQTQTEACKGHHATRKDFYANMRLLPPVNITSVEGNRLEWLYADRGLELGSLELEADYSVVPHNFSPSSTDCYGITYCERHKTVLSIQELPKDFCKGVK